MMKLESKILNKGLFALLVVAIAGTVGAVHFAQAATNDDTTGYGTTGQQATAAADKFAAAINTSDNTFGNQVDALSVQAEDATKSASPTRDFDDTFNVASEQYLATLNNAFSTFVTQANQAANTAQSKDQFIDQFNNAKATYLNSLDAAKNQFAAALSPLGDAANQAKDAFIGGFNTDRDAYSNQLEQAKNDFAATVSNL